MHSIDEKSYNTRQHCGSTTTKIERKTKCVDMENNGGYYHYTLKNVSSEQTKTPNPLISNGRCERRIIISIITLSPRDIAYQCEL